MTRPIKAQFWYCPDNAHGCVSSHPRVVVLGRPTTTPKVWPVLRGTNLTQDEADQLSTAGFAFLPSPGFPLRPHPRVLERQVNIANHAWPKTRAGKAIRRNQPGKSHFHNPEQVPGMIAEVTRFTNVPPLGFGRVYTLCIDGSATQGIVYRVTISDYPTCDCPHFSKMMAKKTVAYVPCKHLYWIYLHRLSMTPPYLTYIQCASLSYSKVEDLFK